MEKFRKKNDFYDFSEEFGIKPNRHENKKKVKTKQQFHSKKGQYDPYEVDWYDDTKRYRK